MTVMPAQKPGKSRQDYPTPRAFLDVVEHIYGPMQIDLACTRLDCKGSVGGLYYPEVDSLAVNWNILAGYKNLWLNPPYKRIAHWVKKCATERPAGASIYLLVPASVGTVWFRNFVYNKADVRFLSPRLSFDGKHPYPKDLMLCIYNGTFGIQPWNWK